MKTIPKKLQIGDTIGILATSGAVEDKAAVERAVNFFESRGYKVVLSKNAFSKNRYLAGSDEEKIEELHRFFEDSSINAIICMRGGYGAIRLIDKIDYDIIQNNPKIFCGYSDISALSAMFLKHAGLITYSGPLAQSDFGREDISEFTIENFFGIVQKQRSRIECAMTDNNWTGSKTYSEGKAQGITFGGNLSTIVSLCGQDFIPDENFIFFAEDLNEPVYKIDKMMTQLLNIEQFRNNITGIVLGDFLDIDNQEWFNKLFTEIGEKLQIPVIGGFKITHAKDKITLPYGAKAELNNNILCLS